SAAGLITDREIIRDTPPDILLTNYKMLDQLLLRHADAKLWSASARSLQYLVLDEFHTYDGAQGTDVAMLIRRLGLALKSHLPTGPEGLADAGITEADVARPLGIVTPVATSATLGDKGDPTAMLDFARTVFGEEFPPESVVTESRLSLDEWVGGAKTRIEARGLRPVEVDDVVTRAVLDDLAEIDPTDPDALTRTVLSHLYREVSGDTGYVDPMSPRPDLAGDSTDDLLDLANALPLVSGERGLARLAEQAVDLGELAAQVLPPSSDPSWSVRAEQMLTAVLSALSHLRTVTERRALSVDVHLWTRELTRLNRTTAGVAQFRWQD